MKNKYFLLFATFILFLNVHAQLDSIKVLTANPTSNDPIKLVAYTSFSTRPCNMLSKVITTPTTGEVYVNTCHDDSMFSVGCSSVDTVTISPLAAGTYKIGYIVRRVNFATDPPTCSNSPIADSMNVHISVTQYVGFADGKIKSNSVSVFPNPASGVISVKYDLNETFIGAKIVVYNLIGQELQQQKLQHEKGIITINIDQLQNGSYYLQIESPTNKSGVQRFQVVN